jgi:hypothetical protein
MKKSVFLLVAAALLLNATVFVSAQDTPPTPTETPAGPGGARPGGPPSGDPQPYDKVITKDAKSKDGVFKVHKIKDKYFYEIPKDQLGKEFLWVTQIAKTTEGVGYGGQALGRRVVRWERIDNKINLRVIDYSIVADPRSEIAEAVRNSNNDTILMSFPVAAFGPNDTAVIDVSRLFTTDLFELSARQRLQATMMDASRSYIEQILTFPTNIEVQATHTYTRNPTPAGLGGGGGGGGFGGAGMSPGSASVVLHHSMVKLPDNPMMPRLFDERVGYFSVSNLDFSRPEQRAQERRFITRWRLEKKDPNAALSTVRRRLGWFRSPNVV